MGTRSPRFTGSRLSSSSLLRKQKGGKRKRVERERPRFIEDVSIYFSIPPSPFFLGTMSLSSRKEGNSCSSLFFSGVFHRTATGVLWEGKKARNSGQEKDPPIKTKPRYLGGPSLDSDLVLLPNSSQHIKCARRQKSIVLSKEIYAVFRVGNEYNFWRYHSKGFIKPPHCLVEGGQE